MLKTLFFGTPDTAVPFLRRLAEKSRVLGVVTAPDRPAGRGHDLAAPAVKRAARELGLPLFQPSSLKDPAALEKIRQWGTADLGVVVAYGYLIPKGIFSHPAQGLVNVHFSLLPRYRGAAPVQWALINGETETGVTLFRIEEGLDSGPIFLQKAVAVAPGDNAPALRGRLSEEGIRLMEEALDRFAKGPWEPAPQRGEASRAPALKKEDGRIPWGRLGAAQAVNLIRGTWEWPGAYTTLQGRLHRVRGAEAAPWEGGAPGEVVSVEKGRGFLIKCASGALRVLRIQPEGKKETDAWDFWNGARLKTGDRFGT